MKTGRWPGDLLSCDREGAIDKYSRPQLVPRCQYLQIGRIEADVLIEIGKEHY